MRDGKQKAETMSEPQVTGVLEEKEEKKQIWRIQGSENKEMRGKVQQQVHTFLKDNYAEQSVVEIVKTISEQSELS